MPLPRVQSLPLVLQSVNTEGSRVPGRRFIEEREGEEAAAVGAV